MGSAGQAKGAGLEVRLEGLKLDCLDALEPARLTLQANTSCPFTKLSCRHVEPDPCFSQSNS